MLRELLFSGGAIGLAILAACSSSDPPAGSTSSSSSSSSGSSGQQSSTSSSTSTSSSGTTPAPTISDKVNISTVQVDVAGNARQYVLALPKNYDASKAYPLIVALHGDGQDANGFASESKLTLATTDQAIVAFTDQVIDLFTDYNDNPDQMLVEATINDVKKSKNIDSKKIWGFGYSKGAFELNMLGCRKPGLFTAMAPHAGGAPNDENGNINCPNATPLPIFITMGSADDPGGGEFEASFWSGLAGCNGADDTTPTTPAYCVKYNGCNAADPLVYCSIANQPHYPLYDNAATDSWNWFKSL